MQIRIFIIAFLAICATANAQVFQTNNTPYKFRGVKADSLLIAPKGCDTSILSNPKWGTSTAGALFVDTCNSRLYYFDGRKWQQSSDTNFIRNQFSGQEQKKFSVIQGKVDALDFNTTSAVADSTQRLTWDNGNGTLNIGLKGGAVNLAVGQEQVARVFNESGSNIVDGELVYITGAQGNRVAVSKASNANAAVAFATIGMATEPIANGAEGFITILGTVNKLNTAAIPEGTELWLGATAGTYTSTKPTYPASIVSIGHVERSHATVGSIYVNIRPELPTVASYGKNTGRDSTILLLTNGQRFAAKDSIGVTDTASLSNRINLKLNISDTSAMLLPYLRKVDTASLSNRINLKLSISDTAAMLLPYQRKADPATVTAAGATGNIQFKNTNGGLSANWQLQYDSALARVGISVAGGPLAKFHVRSNGLGAYTALAVDSAGILIGNITTPTSFGTRQNSPPLVFAAQGWDGTAAREERWRIVAAPAINLSNQPQLRIQNSLNGAAYTTSLVLDANGTLRTTAITNSGLLTMAGTTNGLILNRLTSTQQAAIAAPTNGELLFNSDSGRVMLRTASAWRGLQFTGEGGTTVTASGATGNIQFKGSDGNFSSNWQLQYDSALARVGISVAGGPLAKFHIRSNGIGSYGNAIAADSSGILLGNITAPTSYATIQNSPPLVFVGQAWTGSAATAQNFRILSRPAGSGTGSSGQLAFQYGLGTGAYADGFTINAGGNSNANGNFNAGGNISSGGSATFGGTVTFNSTSRGAILNRLTATQRNAIGSPTAGEFLYDTDSGRVMLRTASAWRGLAFTGEGGGVTTMAAVGSSPNANGATISGSTLTLQPADASNPGVVTTGAQDFEGRKYITSGGTRYGSLRGGGTLFEIESESGFTLDLNRTNTASVNVAGAASFNRTGSSLNTTAFFGDVDVTSIGEFYMDFPSSSKTRLRVGLNGVTYINDIVAGLPSAQNSALLQLSSTTRGFLPPRMTAAQANAISSPAEGLMVYVTDTGGTPFNFTSKGWWGYNGTTWEKLNN